MQTRCHRGRLLVLVVALLASSSLAGAADHVLPFYSLPEPGSWVEWEYVHRSAANGVVRERGTLRLAALGTVEIGNVTLRRIDVVRATNDDPPRVRRRRVLVRARRGGTLERRDVVSVLDLDVAGEPRTLTAVERNRFLHLGLTADRHTTVVERKSETVTTDVGRFESQRIRAGNTDDPDRFVYRAWLQPAFPFGLVRFEIREPGPDGRAVTTFETIPVRMGSLESKR